MSDSTLPTIDMSPFFNGKDGHGKNKAMLEIGKACSEYGFFLATNHGVPLHLMSRALQVSETFFEKHSDEEKTKYSPKPGDTIPAGYFKSLKQSRENNEHLFMLSPDSGQKLPPGFQPVLEEMYSHFTKLGSKIESVINDWLGLPSDFLKQYNDDRSWDFLLALRYFPASSESESLGKNCHTDGNCVTFVFQDSVDGLEFCRDGKWVPVNPPQGTLVVNIGDIIQVLSNGKFKSTTHRVRRPVGSKSRYSYAFFYSFHGDKLVEPLPHFTVMKGESPKFRGFLYKEYAKLRVRNRTHPPEKPEDLIGINYYAI